MWGWAVATLNRPCFWDVSSHCAGDKPIKGGAWEHVTTKTLPWKLQIQHLGISNFPLTWHCKCLLTFLDTHLDHSPSQCHNTPFCLLSCLGKKVLSNSHKAIPHSPPSVPGCDLFPGAPPSWLYFSVVSCAFQAPWDNHLFVLCPYSSQHCKVPDHEESAWHDHISN